jgi:hypothetical protein
MADQDTVVKPIPIEKRQKMQALGDYTVNAVGPENATKPFPVVKDATTELVDGFIRDGWVLPENRDAELAGLYQLQMRAVSRELQSLRLAIDRQHYASAWVGRVVEYMEGDNG